MVQDDCPLVWDKCSHSFHMHCILKWIDSQQQGQRLCAWLRKAPQVPPSPYPHPPHPPAPVSGPMCRQEWEFK